MRVGQPVTLEADVYGSKVSTGQGRRLLRRHRLGLLAAAGAECHRQLDQVVQRLPVRIALDPQQLKDHPLRVGLSMNVTVDVRREEGAAMAAAPAPRPLQTDVYEKVGHDADALIERIISNNNGGRPASLPATRRPTAPAPNQRPPTPTADMAATASAPASPDRKPDTAARPAPRPAAPAPLTGGRLIIGTIALSLATFMNVLDSSIANVSIPAISGDLGVAPNRGAPG